MKLRAQSENVHNCVSETSLAETFPFTQIENFDLGKIWFNTNLNLTITTGCMKTI